MSISYVGDLLISGADLFAAFLSGGLGGGCGVEVFEGGESTCL